MGVESHKKAHHIPVEDFDYTLSTMINKFCHMEKKDMETLGLATTITTNAITLSMFLKTQYDEIIHKAAYPILLCEMDTAASS